MDEWKEGMKEEIKEGRKENSSVVSLTSQNTICLRHGLNM
jgi:hypothetical protein